MRKTRSKYLYLFLCPLLFASCAAEADPAEKKPEEVQEPAEFVLTCKQKQGSTIYRAAGDEVTEVEQTIVVKDSEVGLKENADRKKAAEALKKTSEDLYDDLKGIEVEVTDQKDGFEIRTTYDLKTASIDSLVQAGILHSGEKDSRYVSFTKTKSGLNDLACPEGLSLKKENS